MFEVIWAAKTNENEFQVLKNPNKARTMEEERKGEDKERSLLLTVILVLKKM